VNLFLFQFLIIFILFLENMNRLFILILFSMIKLSISCHNEGTKFVNEPCVDDSECYNGGDKLSIRCINRSCKCNYNYADQQEWFAPNQQKLVCVPGK